jgi:hypothetical protein
MFSFCSELSDVGEPVVIYYAALPFTHVEDGLAPGQGVECPHGAAAIRRAQALALRENGCY